MAARAAVAVLIGSRAPEIDDLDSRSEPPEQPVPREHYSCEGTRPAPLAARLGRWGVLTRDSIKKGCGVSEALTSRPIPQRTAAISPGIRKFPKKDSGRKPQPSNAPPKATLKPPASLTAWCTDGVRMVYGWCTDGVRRHPKATPMRPQCDPKATLKPL